MLLTFKNPDSLSKPFLLYSRYVGTMSRLYYWLTKRKLRKQNIFLSRSFSKSLSKYEENVFCTTYRKKQCSKKSKNSWNDKCIASFL